MRTGREPGRTGAGSGPGGLYHRPLKGGAHETSVLEARFVVGFVVELPVGAERRVHPLAVPDLVGVFRSPALAFLHRRIGDQITLEEASLPVLEGIALRVHLGLVTGPG